MKSCLAPALVIRLLPNDLIMQLSESNSSKLKS